MAGLSLEDDVVQLGCTKISEDGRKLIVNDARPRTERQGGFEQRDRKDFGRF